MSGQIPGAGQGGPPGAGGQTPQSSNADQKLNQDIQALRTMETSLLELAQSYPAAVKSLRSASEALRSAQRQIVSSPGLAEPPTPNTQYRKMLDAAVKQAAGGNGELERMMTEYYTANEAAAVQFVNGFTTTADYTRKNQQLADDRRAFDTEKQQFATEKQQLDQVRGALTAAEQEKDKILKELAGHRMSVAKARELMRILQDKYALTDEDLPGMSDLIETRKVGKPVDSTEDVAVRIKEAVELAKKEIRDELTKTLVPELGGMAVLPIVWSEIGREHAELTGKPLSFAEQQEIYKSASSTGKSLRDVWEDKYQITAGTWGDGLRMQKRDERLKTQWTQEREKAEADARSKAALEQVTPQPADFGAGPGISRAFTTKFKEYQMDPGQPAVKQGDGVPSLQVLPGQHARRVGSTGPSAAQRAAAKFIERGGPAGYGKKSA